MKDLTLDKDYGRGSRGNKVRLIQEWLCLHGLAIVVDGDFGPATERTVKEFQRARELAVDGIVGQRTFAKLVLPMMAALEPVPPNGKTVGEMMCLYAEQHLGQHPREVGGQNKGPWVRLYMNGNQGSDWPWCAGFACFILKQACRTLDTPSPIRASFSCDSLASSAKQRGVFLGEREAEDRSLITPGSFFLSRRTPTDWVHTGLVLHAERDYFRSIEGNTNDEGHREGYEVCRRTRGYRRMDFVRF